MRYLLDNRHASPLLRRSTHHCIKGQPALCRCVASRELLKHHQKCISPECLICVPVKQHVQTQRLAAHLQQQQRAAAAAQDPALQQQLFQQQQALLQHGAASQQQMMAGMMQVSTPQTGSGKLQIPFCLHEGTTCGTPKPQSGSKRESCPQRCITAWLLSSIVMWAVGGRVVCPTTSHTACIQPCDSEG